MGWSKPPAIFQDFLQKVHKFLHRFVLVYIDDILIYWSLAEHCCHVTEVLKKLPEYHLFLEAEQYYFLFYTITFTPMSLSRTTKADNAFKQLKLAFTSA